MKLAPIPGAYEWHWYEGPRCQIVARRDYMEGEHTSVTYNKSRDELSVGGYRPRTVPMAVVRFLVSKADE